MAKTQRLFELLQLLRRRRRPVRGVVLAEELGVSIRTLYRDIDTLKTYGAAIDGEPGIGYILHPGFTLPPLMFSEDEIEAVSLGVRWVAESTDAELSKAAGNVLAKIAAVLPDHLRGVLYTSPLLIGPKKAVIADHKEIQTIRKAIQQEKKIAIRYKDQHEKITKRTIWPFGLAFFEEVRVVIAWCEKRNDVRHFRVDRIQSLSELSEQYPTNKVELLNEWRRKKGLPEM